jgi:hypothetical protein
LPGRRSGRPDAPGQVNRDLGRPLYFSAPSGASLLPRKVEDGQTRNLCALSALDWRQQ